MTQARHRRLHCFALASLAISLSIFARAEDLPQSRDPYFLLGQSTLAERLALRPGEGRARNVILFIADGGGVASTTAARIAAGQRHGTPGEEHILSYEAFPYLALAKTYTVDGQIPDSAGTATAILSGAKTRNGVIGVGPAVMRGDCPAALANRVTSLGELAEARGMATGIITTARITHATPAAFYAHAPDRDWENDAALPPGSPCTDIAQQLIDFPFEVAFGGGREHFLPAGTRDIEEGEGKRHDGRNLIDEWRAGGPGRVVVQTMAEFDHVTQAGADRVLGLFNPSHMEFDADRPADRGGEPSLAEMTRTAIRLLARDPDGYLLLVEAGRIDHALHGHDLQRAVTDGLALDEAVAAAISTTDPAETLIIVTSDHVNLLPPWGHKPRGTPVAGLDRWSAADRPPPNEGGGIGLGEAIVDLVGALIFGPPPQEPAGPGSHGAEDVPVYARGPMAHLLGGTVEQSYLFHVMRHALALESPD